MEFFVFAVLLELVVLIIKGGVGCGNFVGCVGHVCCYGGDLRFMFNVVALVEFARKCMSSFIFLFFFFCSRLILHGRFQQEK